MFDKAGIETLHLMYNVKSFCLEGTYIYLSLSLSIYIYIFYIYIYIYWEQDDAKQLYLVLLTYIRNIYKYI